MQVKPYTQKELDDILEMLKQGATYQEIAEMTGRTAAAIQVKISSERIKKAKAEKNDSPSQEDVTSQNSGGCRF